MPDRFQLQYDYLTTHPDCVALGCQSLHVNEKGERIGEGHYPTSPLAIRWEALFRSPILHPGSMYRRLDVLALGGYRKEFDVAEDYDLWTRLLTRGTLGNLPQQLLRYRVHARSVCAVHKDKQVRQGARIAGAYLSTLNSGVEARCMEELYLFLATGLPSESCSMDEIIRAFHEVRDYFHDQADGKDTELEAGLRHQQDSLRWRCTVLAEQNWRRPWQALAWLRRAGRVDPGRSGLTGLVRRRLARVYLASAFALPFRPTERFPHADRHEIECPTSILRKRDTGGSSRFAWRRWRRSSAEPRSPPSAVPWVCFAPVTTCSCCWVRGRRWGTLRKGRPALRICARCASPTAGTSGIIFVTGHVCGRSFELNQPDILHANDLPTHQAVAGAAHRLPIARLCHHRQIFNGRAIAWFDKFGAHHHVFVSRSLMDDLCTASPPLRERSRSVLYDGLELPLLPTSADRAAARDKLGLNPDRCLVLFAGQIIVRKGVADLLEAWARLPANLRENAELLIVGEDLEHQGAYRAEMEQLAARLAVPARFCGFQKNVGEWLTAAEISVVPSHVEPLGNATLEAMSFGLPVIGGQVGGIPEMIEHGQTGLLVPAKNPEKLAEAIATLLADRDFRNRLGQAGRVRCEREFSLTAHTNALVQEYERTIAIRKNPQARCQPC